MLLYIQNGVIVMRYNVEDLYMPMSLKMPFQELCGIKQRGLLAILEVFVLSNEQSQYVDTQTNQPTDQILNQA